MTREGTRRDESVTGFIAVVKILKVSKKSALTHPVKIKIKSQKAFSQETMPKAGEEDEHWFIFLAEIKEFPARRNETVLVVVQQRLCGPRSSLKF